MHAPVEVLDNRRVAAGVHRLVLARPPGWQHRPGQVAELARAPGAPGYYALASAPDEGELAFLVKLGPDTGPLTGAAVGARVGIRGPFGAGFDLPPARPGRRLAFIGAGTALAALRSGLVAAGHAGHAAADLALVVGVRRPGELAFAAELAALAAAGVTLTVVVSRPAPDDTWRGPVGWVQDHLAGVGAGERFVFVAGSDVLEDAVVARLVEAGLPLDHIQRNYRPDARVSARAASAALAPDDR